MVQNGNAATLDYVTTDQLNTPRAITDSSKTVDWSWTSDPFGNGQPTGSLTYNLRFPGQYYDAETGHNYNLNRDYDSSTGRYIESDPIGLGGGDNTYAYGEGDPMNMADPLGLLVWSTGATDYENDLAGGQSYMVFPGGYSAPLDPAVLGITTVNWQISADCQCDGKGGV